jgi:hypothetical protein
LSPTFLLRVSAPNVKLFIAFVSLRPASSSQLMPGISLPGRQSRFHRLAHLFEHAAASGNTVITSFGAALNRLRAASSTIWLSSRPPTPTAGFAFAWVMSQRPHPAAIAPGFSSGDLGGASVVCLPRPRSSGRPLQPWQMIAPAPARAANELLRYGWEFSAASGANPRLVRRAALRAGAGRRQSVRA